MSRRPSRARAGAKAAGDEARNQEIEAQIRTAPDDPAPYQIYADWLQERFPKLTRFRLDGPEPYGAAEALGRVAAHFGGAELELPLAGSTGAMTLDALGDDARARLVRLQFDLGDQGAPRELADRELAAVRRLTVHSPSSELRNTIFDGPWLPALPGLTSVEIEGLTQHVGLIRSLTRSELSKRMRKLTLCLGRPGPTKALAEGPRFEQLEQLELGFDSTLGPDYLQSPRLLASETFAGVRSLHLDPPQHLGALPGTPLAEQLVELEVTLDRDRDAEQLLAVAPKLPKLERLVVSGPRRLSADKLRALFALEAEVVWAP